MLRNAGKQSVASLSYQNQDTLLPDLLPSTAFRLAEEDGPQLYCGRVSYVCRCTVENHPRSAAQRRMTAQKHPKLLHQLIRVFQHRYSNLSRLATCPCSEGGCMLAFGYWNALIALPVDDPFCDVFYSLQEAVTPGPRKASFAKGERYQCVLLCSGIVVDQAGLLPICLEAVMKLSWLQLQSEAVDVDVS